jgi:hypothetical protein
VVVTGEEKNKNETKQSKTRRHIHTPYREGKKEKAAQAGMTAY